MVFIVLYMFIEALQAESAWWSLSLPWFTPQRADVSQAGAAPSCASPCSVQCPSPAGAPGCCGPRDNSGIVIAGRNSSCFQSKTSVGGVTSGFLLRGDRAFSSVQGWPHVSPPNGMTG